MSTGESAAVLIYLMSLADPSAEVVAAVQAGIATLRELAEMRSGIPSYTFNQSFQDTLFSDPNHVWTPQELVDLVKGEFPLAKVFARAFDRGHAIELVKLGVDYQIREVYESALEFGAETLKALGADEDEVAEIVLGVRERDRQRFSAQIVGGMMASRDLLLSNAEDQARESGTVAGPTDPILAPEPGALTADVTLSFSRDADRVEAQVHAPDGTPYGDPAYRSGASGDVIHFTATQATFLGFQYWQAYGRATALTAPVPSARTMTAPGPIRRSSSRAPGWLLATVVSV